MEIRHDISPVIPPSLQANILQSLSVEHDYYHLCVHFPSSCCRQNNLTLWLLTACIVFFKLMEVHYHRSTGISALNHADQHRPSGEQSCCLLQVFHLCSLDTLMKAPFLFRGRIEMVLSAKQFTWNSCVGFHSSCCQAKSPPKICQLGHMAFYITRCKKHNYVFVYL